MEESTDGPCQICNLSPYRYVCPRCNLAYCSVKCYQSSLHLHCSESFYKECIETELKAMKNTHSREEMLDILKRCRDDSSDSLDSDDESEESDFAERLKDVDLDDANAIWDVLNEEEKNDFRNVIASDDLSGLVVLITPWWDLKYPKPKITDANVNVRYGYTAGCPKYFPDLPPFSTFSKQEPSEFLHFNVLNVISAYAICARYYNFHHKEFPREAASVLGKISKTLCANQIFKSCEEARLSVLQETMSLSFIKLTEDSAARMELDVCKILDGPNEEDKNFFVLSALTDIRMLFKAARKENGLENKPDGNFSKEFSDNSENCIDFLETDVLNKMVKKMEYYIAWGLSDLYVHVVL